MPNTVSPFARPVYVMLKPVGDSCNLACRYCYYTGHGHAGVMSQTVLEAFTRQYLEAQTAREVLFTWHGGEPLLRPLSFYRYAVELQRRYAGECHVDNCIQTNGTLLTDEWCQFLADHHFLVGISIDGPQPLHDGPSAVGRGFRGNSWHDVMRAVRLLDKYGVAWNAMATVNAANADRPAEFYHFFRSIGCQFLQFTPVVEPLKPRVSVTPQQWGRFLCTLYDEWVRRDVGTLFVQLFDATLANWAGVPPSVCALQATCGQAAAMDADGTVYSCDHFVDDAHRLGNIMDEPLVSLLYSSRQQRFGLQKQSLLPRQCRECRWLGVCHGECPKNRTATDCYGQPGLNSLCSGYRQFFSHVASDMDFMKAELDAGRPPANIMAQKMG